jgi:hypothetical protein
MFGGHELTMIRNSYVKFSARSIQGHTPVAKPGADERQGSPYFLNSTKIWGEKK